MGRKKKKTEDRKAKISITLEKECMNFIIENYISSKSDFVNWLIREHFNQLEK